MLSNMSNPRTNKSRARQRLIETAERLFYAEGIHTVGIDRIIDKAGVAKMTLYNHFSSKDDLILAVLQYREEQVNELFTRSVERYASKGMDRLEAFFRTLKDWFESPGFRGCSFINASVELANREHPASQFSSAHKDRFHKLIRQLIVEAAGENAASVAPAVSLLVEGAIVTAVLEKSSKSADVAREAAVGLILRVSNKRK